MENMEANSEGENNEAMAEIGAETGQVLAPHIGLTFAKQGLSRLCDFVSFDELKSFRLVCFAWNCTASTHPRYRSSLATFKERWINQARDFHFDSITKWENLKLRHLPLHRNTLFRTYWTQTATAIKSLILEEIKVGCTQLGKIIDSCTRLESVEFFKINFDALDITGVGGPAEAAQPAVNIPQQWDNPIYPNYKVYCSHENHTGPTGPPTIKNISISKTETFPICLLDLLRKRSQGMLEKFSFTANTEGTEGNPVNPSMTQMEGHIIRLCQASPQTLKYFLWTRNNADGNIYNALNADPGFQVETLTIACRHLENRWDHQFNPTPPAILLLVQSQNLLVELNLALNWTAEMRDEMAIWLPRLTNLRTMKLQVDKMNQNQHQPTNVNIFGQCSNIWNLILIDRTLNLTQRDWGWHGDNPGIGMAHLTALPMTLRQLTCAHRFRNENLINAALANPTFRSLTKLVILDGTQLTDEIIQRLITNVVLLEDLTIKNANRVTDSGLTGLNPRACQILVECRTHGLLLKKPAEGSQVGHSLRELTHLRKLDFSKCVRISDVSYCYALQFPELHKLVLNCTKVSDLSLGWLGVHNPKLSVLEVKKCRQISHHGINRLIGATKNLCQIHTDKMASKRLENTDVMEQNYKEHPLFKDIVKVKNYTRPPKCHNWRLRSKLDIEI